MKRNCQITGILALMVISTLTAPRVNGALWNESIDGGGDAGQLTAGAQIVTGPSDLSGISGTLSSTTDRDLYLIRINDQNNFTITVTSGDNTTDTILALFNSSGFGVVLNDDGTFGDGRSQLTGSSGLVSTAGDYYLAIMAGGQLFANGDGAIWNDRSSPWTGQFAPDGLGADSALASYNVVTTPPLIGAYTIEFGGGPGSITPIPEPAHYGVACALMGIIVAVATRRNARKPATAPRAGR